MTSIRMRGVRRGLGMFAAAVLLGGASGARAQESHYPPGAVVQPLPDRDAGAELRRHLTTLADNPRSASALVGAGRAALRLGDTPAAVSFFARADEVAPRDPRVKAGMASALVQMEQGQAALDLFAEAVALGAPEEAIAADRGLAYELVGEPRRAQQDYASVLRRGDDPEVRRRMALSLAISGEREAALAVIDDQLRQQDRAAWRVRAFILALTGDAAGAAETARVTMPPEAARAIAPFLARLAGLNPAQQAMAVHFGRFPSDGQRAPMAATDTSADPDALALAGRGGRSGEALRPRNPAAEPASRAPRRRPGARTDSAERVGAGTRPPPDQARRQREERRRQRERAAATQEQPVRTEPAPPVQAAELRPRVDSPAPAPAAGRESPAEPGFEDIAALVAALPPEPESTPSRAEPAAARRQAAPPPRSEPPRAARTAHPARHWVQIAGGADRAALPREFARLAGLAPELLRGRTAWTTPLRFTNRLLVGPFESEEEAQAFVNLLAVKEVAAFAWTSPAGQEIERLTAGR